MDYTATELRFLNGTSIELTFLDGKIIQFDVSKLFDRYPQFKKLQNDRSLFVKGKLWPLGEVIYWDDEIELDTIWVYQEGTVIGYNEPSLKQKIALLLSKTREDSKLTQTQLSKLSGIDQGDISRIERGLGNPTLHKIEKLFNSLGKSLEINVK